MANTLKHGGSSVPGSHSQEVDPASITKKAAQGGMWLGAFRLISQVISWVMTIAVVRMLSPDDYGLMAMAGILTGYIEVFSELGLGSAIIQKENVSERELSSNFWFSLGLGCFFGLTTFILAYPTAWLFDEPRAIPLTQAISILFVIDGLKVVPVNILIRDFRFKAVGAIQLSAAIVSSVAMFFMASHGFGVWTLIGGIGILRFVLLILSFPASKWMPRLLFSFEEIRPFLKFGLGVAGTRSLFYVFMNLDRFIVGKLLGSEALGYYSFAMNLANLPLDKSMSVLGQVALPMFSRLQRDLKSLRDSFTSLTKYTTLIIAPLYLGGAAFGDHIIQGILGDKWLPIVFIFRVLCLVQFIGIAVSLSNVVNYALGRSHWPVVFYSVNILLMPPALYVAVHYSLDSVSIPWLTIYPLLCVGYLYLTVRAIELPLSKYLIEGFSATGSAVGMICCVAVLQALLPVRVSHNVLIVDVCLGVLIYGAYHLIFNRASLKALKVTFLR